MSYVITSPCPVIKFSNFKRGVPDDFQFIVLLVKPHENVIHISHKQTHKHCADNFTASLQNPWWRHEMETFSALLAICAGNSPVPVNSPHKDQRRGALMFSLICTWMNAWVNDREAGDLRLYRAHYDVTVMNIKRVTNSMVQILISSCQWKLIQIRFGISWTSQNWFHANWTDLNFCRKGTIPPASSLLNSTSHDVIIRLMCQRRLW